MNPATAVSDHKIVSRSEWLRARSEFLAKEKELTHLSDQLAQKRQELPWTKVEKDYVFTGLQGKSSLAQLFDGRSQLATYHFMFGPDWGRGVSGLLVPDGSHGRRGRTPAGAPCLVRPCLAGSRREACGVSAAHGLALYVGFVGGLGFQSRLRRVLHQARGRQRQERLQLCHDSSAWRRESRSELLLPGSQRRRVSYLLRLWPRTGIHAGNVRDSRPGAEGTRRSGVACADVVGASSRQI
jgi:hypothetical protein